jgi:hypothetical protein
VPEDIRLYFGDNSHIVRSGSAGDFLVISGSAAGLVLSGNLVKMSGPAVELEWDPKNLTDETGPELRFRSNTTAVNDTTLGTIGFYANDSTTGDGRGAKIVAYAPSAWDAGNANDRPTELQFWTTMDGYGSGLTQRMTLSHLGDLGVGVSDPDTKLEVLEGVAEQLKLSHDGSNYSTFGTSDTGDLTILSSGGDNTKWQHILCAY